MGVASDGSYGVPENLYFSFPVTCRNNQWHIVQVRHRLLWVLLFCCFSCNGAHCWECCLGSRAMRYLALTPMPQLQDVYLLLWLPCDR